MVEPIPVAVVGVGYLGRFHAQKYKALPQSDLVAVVDSDPARAKAVGEELDVPYTSDLASILKKVQAVSVAVPTPHHHATVKACLEAGVAVLVEKPIAASSAEAEELVALAQQKNLPLQVGHLERFNPAFTAVKSQIDQPQFIEAVRISAFKERGADVDVVLDLMSHDLDLVLGMVSSPLRDLHAVGVSVVTARTDLANVRLMFENGCVANLTASRISAKAERKLRVFQRNRYFSLDLGGPEARVFSSNGGNPENGESDPAALLGKEEETLVEPGDALLLEIESFLDSIATGNPPAVTGEDGLAMMRLAERIIEDIRRNQLP